MNAAVVARLYAYNDWANARLLAAISTLSDEQYTRPIVSSFPSIRETLSHIAFAEWLWLRRWRGESPSALPDWTKEPSCATLAERLREVAADRRAYLAELDGDAIATTIHYRSMLGDSFGMPLGELFLHCANHSTYHRGQLVTMLRQVGATPPNTDYTQFLRS